MKKLLAILLAVMMIAALAVPAFAAEETDTVKVTLTGAETEQVDSDKTTAETYKAYKILSATVAENSEADNNARVADQNGIIYYTTDQDVADALSDWFDFDEGFVFEGAAYIVDWTAYSAIEENDEDLLAVAQEFAEKTYDLDVNDSKNVELGLYVIESSLGSNLVVITSNMTIEQKNEYPTFTKELADEDEDTYAGIGDAIEYVINVTVPDTVNQDVVITDTPDSNLIIDDATIDFWSDGDVDYEIARDDDNAIIIFTISADEAGNDVEIDYALVLGTEARSGNEYKNSAVLTYSNYVSKPQDASTWTNKFTVTKIDGDDNTQLEGAELQLLNEDGDPIKLVKIDGSETELRLATEDDTDTVESFISSADDATVIEGLDSNFGYAVNELKAPTGYNLLEQPEDLDATDGGDYDIAVKNFTGTVLPSTGGIGTTIFYVVGGILVLAAGVVLITKKRLAKEED